MDPASTPGPGILTFVDPRMAKRLKPVPKLFPVLVIFIASLVLAGWQFDVPALRSISSHFVSMKPNTAVGLILAAISLLVLQSSRPSRVKYHLSRVLTSSVLILSGVTLLEYLASWNPGLDTLLFTEKPGAIGTLMPGRMEPITAINLFLLGVALTSMNPSRTRRHPLSHILSFPIALTALLPAVAYLYGASLRTGLGDFSAMAPQTALCFLLMACSLSLAHLNHDLAAVLVSEGPGGSIARRILPAAILIPLLLGWLRVLGERTGVFSVEFGTALYTTANIGGLLIVVWLQSVALQRIEVKRRAMQRERDSLNIQSEQREQFVAMLSHDLRNPLTAANMCAQMIHRNPDQGEFTRSNAEKIIQSISRSDRLIQDLLEVTRVRAGHPMQLTVTECDLAAIAQSIAQELAMLHGSRFIFEGDPEIKGRWDPIALRRVLENLCNNAVKYGAPGSPITIQAVRLHEKVRLSVHNLGTAIPAEELKSLFEPFQRASTATGKGKQGWGLGLALVHGITEAHRGRVLVESSAEKGTVFTIEMPGTDDHTASHKTAS